MRALDVRPLSLGSLARLLRGQGDAALRARCPDPVLVVSVPGAAPSKVDTPPAGIALARSEETTVSVGDRTLTPLDRLRVPAERPAAALRFGADSLVKPLVKSDRNPFADVITVGRAANNDVAIESPQVSKVHAWIRSATGGLVISDNGSTNGTLLDGVRLVPEVDYRLRPGAAVRLGPIECLVADVDVLLDLCLAI